MTTRGAAKRPATAGRIVVGARACNACSGTPRCAVVTSAAFACWLTTLMSMTVHIFGVRHRRMSVIERARQVQGLSGRRVRRARPSEPRAGTVTPLSVRTLTGGDVGIGRDVRPSYVQVGAGARMYGFTTRGGRGLPSIRALDNMDTPFRHLLVLLEPQTLQVQGGIVAVEIRVRRDDAGQARRRFQCEALRQRVVRILAIRGVPPVEDPFLRGSQQRVGRQPIAFLVLIDLPVGGHQIPEIAAGPDGPGKAVIDVEVGGAQPLAAPDAVETSCGEQLLGALPGNPHVPGRVRPCHCRGQPGFVKRSSLFRSVTLCHAYPFGDDGGLDPCAEALNGRPQVRRHAHRSKAGKIGSVQPYVWEKA